jgi:hypothetical protein
LHLVPLYDHPKLDGTYGHQKGAPDTWYVVMDHVIRRTIGGKNEPTAIRLHVPRETTVGDVVQLDGRETWDPDGDAFELIWKVKVKGCVGKGKVLPRDQHDCPEGYKLDDWVVRTHAGSHGQNRELTIPLIGDYHVEVHAKIGQREEPVSSFLIRAFPRRAWSFYTKQGVLRAPTNFLSDSGKSELAFTQSFGLSRRYMHRLGFFGFYEEAHLGLSIGVLQQLSTYNYKGRNVATPFTVDVVGRELDRTGHYGVTTTGSFSVGPISATRGGSEREEWAWLITTFIGGYYTFGDNNQFHENRFCFEYCPSVALGPTLTLLDNLTTDRIGISLGIEAQIALEF